MCRKWIISLGIFLTFHNAFYAQNAAFKSVLSAESIISERGEAIIRFVRPHHYSLNELTSEISIDQVYYDTITAYVNKEGLRFIKGLHIPYEIIAAPSLKKEIFTSWSAKKVDSLGKYPSWSEYINLMQSFEDRFPDLCRLRKFGTSAGGRDLLVLKISDLPDDFEHEPVVFFAASLHGDEPLGYVMMLRLCEFLLNGYTTNPEIKSILDDTEVWINPLANPDGAFFLSDTSLFGSTRFNKNNKDLNRDYPDIRYPDSENQERQPETMAIMQLLEEIRPALAANFHGGAEVVNYPWDTWAAKHADDIWYRHISRKYADTVHIYSPSDYMTFLDNGITNGYAWYPLFGGQQDYLDYYLRGREVTIELSDNKIPDENLLEAYWNYNRQSLVHFIKDAHTGFSGFVTDSLTGAPVKGVVTISDHDDEHSAAISEALQGEFTRLIGPGSYHAVITAPGYAPASVTVNVSEGILTQVNVHLKREAHQPLSPNPFVNQFHFYIDHGGYELEVNFVDQAGRLVKESKQMVTQEGNQEILTHDLQPGFYIVLVRYHHKSWKIPALKIAH